MEVDLSDGARQALHAAQNASEDAVLYVQKELSSLKKQYSDLQGLYAALQKKHLKLQQEYESKSNSWRDFKSWWKMALEKKQSDHMLSSDPISNPLPTDGQTPQRKRKVGLSDSEKMLLDKIGLESSSGPTPASSKTKNYVRVKREEVDENENDGQKSHTMSNVNESPLKKRIKSDVKVKEETMGLNRSPLQDVSNRSDTPIEEITEPTTVAEALRKERLRKVEELRKDPLKYKGRGRYSTGISKDYSVPKTINGEFVIDAERNGDVTFLHKSVVRGKAERNKMHANDCECCSSWYEAVGEAPLRKYQDPRTLRSGKDDEGDNSEDEAERKKQVHRQQISRHRAYGPPASTPPGYWDVEFPSTQQLEEINQKAREEHQKKYDQMDRDPRFKRR